VGSRILFLAPAGSKPAFGATNTDSNRWRSLLAKACHVRGETYLKDGAIKTEDLDSNGGFSIPLDHSSWHMALMDDEERISATLRLTSLPIDSKKRKGSLPHVGESIRRSATDPLSSRLALERYLSGMGLTFGSERATFLVVGGWATSPTLALPGAGAELALAAWAYARMSQAAGAICVASERHDAHGQLVRTGAVPILAVNSKEMYYDPAYSCHVGILGFRVFQERRALRRAVDQLTERINDSEVVINSAA